MSDSENYFSDSDKTNNDNDNEIDIDEFGFEENSIDEESLRIIYEANKKNRDKGTQVVDEPIIKKKKKVKERKSKDVMTLTEFLDKDEDTKTKKWISSKLNKKREELGIKVKPKIKKRQFNPRLPVPNQNTFKKEVQADLNYNDEEFPELDIDV